MKKILFSAALLCAVTMTACGDKGAIRMGSLSDFDSLSYALGASVGYGMKQEMSNMPFDFEAMEKGIVEGALGKSKQTGEESMNLLREYFTSKHGERAQMIAAEHAQADSARMAAGDSTKMEYPADSRMFENEEERNQISYAYGNSLGASLKMEKMPVQLVWITEAMANVREGDAKMTADQAQQYIQYYFMEKRPKEAEQASKEWLEKIAKKSGVKKTESGLLYKINKAGDESIKATDPRDEVKVHYTGRTRDGKVFDTSIFKNRTKEQQEMMRKYQPDAFDEKGNPKQPDEAPAFALNRVIPGWSEGMMLVGKGGKITLWIPAEMAYGARGAGRDIGPNEALEFEVELIDVIPYVEPAPVVSADSTATATPAQ